MTQRHARLWSGVVLWIYIATHMLNHALGLWSIGAAEEGLRLAVRLWQSLPGSFALYGAFACHLGLALWGLYQRRSLRMPPMEVCRIAFGLTFPLMLVGHAVTTRLAYEWYDLMPQYQSVVMSLMQAGGQGRQLALLAPGWAHGCMGLHMALRPQAWYARGRWLVWVGAAALPLLAAVGFLAMDQEVTRLAMDPQWRNRFTSPLTAAQAASLGQRRELLLSIYFALLACVPVARALRWWGQRPHSSPQP